MMKKMGLGRGLDALLPDSDFNQAGIAEISLNKIDRNPSQPRRQFNEESLNALAESIRSSGILTPLLVVENGGRYRIVAGERRFRAARLAGLTSVPCIVRNLTQQQEMEAALIENLQREDLNAIEEAEAIRALMEQCGYTQEMAARRLGKSRPAVANALRLLGLEKDMREAVIAGRLSAGHARVLVGIGDPARRRRLYDMTLNEGLSVRALEKLAQEPEPAPTIKPRAVRPIPPELSDMQDRFQAAVGVRAALVGNEKKGRIVLSYRTPEELDLIYAALETIEGRG